MARAWLFASGLVQCKPNRIGWEWLYGERKEEGGTAESLTQHGIGLLKGAVNSWQCQKFNFMDVMRCVYMDVYRLSISRELIQ